MAKSRRVKIGEIGVDAGMCYMGDPCYIHSTPLGLTGTDDDSDQHWREFLQGVAGPQGYLENYATVMGTLPNGVTKFPAGVVCVTGHGDGCYPVYAEFAADGSIARVTIDFTGR